MVNLFQTSLSTWVRDRSRSANCWPRCSCWRPPLWRSATTTAFRTWSSCRPSKTTWPNSRSSSTTSAFSPTSTWRSTDTRRENSRRCFRTRVSPGALKKVREWLLIDCFSEIYRSRSGQRKFSYLSIFCFFHEARIVLILFRADLCFYRSSVFSKVLCDPR